MRYKSCVEVVIMAVLTTQLFVVVMSHPQRCDLMMDFDWIAHSEMRCGFYFISYRPYIIG